MSTTLSPGNIDDDSRMREFLSRHGGGSAVEPRRGETIIGAKGWSEIYAADGYTLRCDWEKLGGQMEMRYEEFPPDEIRRADPPRSDA